jgi:hypothetical protein
MKNKLLVLVTIITFLIMPKYLYSHNERGVIPSKIVVFSKSGITKEYPYYRDSVYLFLNSFKDSFINISKIKLDFDIKQYILITYAGDSISSVQVKSKFFKKSIPKDKLYLIQNLDLSTISIVWNGFYKKPVVILTKIYLLKNFKQYFYIRATLKEKGKYTGLKKIHICFVSRNFKYISLYRIRGPYWREIKTFY